MRRNLETVGGELDKVRRALLLGDAAQEALSKGVKFGLTTELIGVHGQRSTELDEALAQAATGILRDLLDKAGDTLRLRERSLVKELVERAQVP